jgi:hypothetical protein
MRKIHKKDNPQNNSKQDTRGRGIESRADLLGNTMPMSWYESVRRQSIHNIEPVDLGGYVGLQA